MRGGAAGDLCRAVAEEVGTDAAGAGANESSLLASYVVPIEPLWEVIAQRADPPLCLLCIVHSIYPAPTRAPLSSPRTFSYLQPIAHRHALDLTCVPTCAAPPDALEFWTKVRPGGHGQPHLSPAATIICRRRHGPPASALAADSNPSAFRCIASTKAEARSPGFNTSEARLNGRTWPPPAAALVFDMHPC